MVKPTKPTAPAQALRSNPDTFPARAEAGIAFAFTTLPDYIDAAMTYADTQVDAANAAALAAGGGSGLDYTGHAGKFLRVNSGATGAEFLGFTAAGLALLDDTTAAAQRLTLGAAPLASPALTGTPTAPTAAVGVSTTQLATTAFVAAEIAADVGVANAAPVKTALNAGGSAPIYACRAWVNFQGDGTVAIRGSGNVSSITDNGLGDYTVNFTTAMPDVNYAATLAYSNELNGQHGVGFTVSQGSAAFRVAHYSAANNTQTMDKSRVNIAIFR